VLRNEAALAPIEIVTPQQLASTGQRSGARLKVIHVRPMNRKWGNCSTSGRRGGQTRNQPMSASFDLT
jgi:hypothetical protein